MKTSELRTLPIRSLYSLRSRINENISTILKSYPLDKMALTEEQVKMAYVQKSIQDLIE